jgi:hypothetical protein
VPRWAHPVADPNPESESAVANQVIVREGLSYSFEYPGLGAVDAAGVLRRAEALDALYPHDVLLTYYFHVIPP